MELYPSWLRKLWKEWDLRVMVLFSLTLQILLNFLGNRRKYSNKLWIRIVVWSAYITADSVATFALGILSSNLIELYDKDPDVAAGSSSSLDANTQLSAFWAPFLLLHLGGPDTITAYALEDNELWLRHLIGLFVQTGMALSVFLMSWTASSLSILSLVMFLPGIIKYGERTWVLRSAGIQQRQESSTSLTINYIYRWLHIGQDFISEEDALRLAEEVLFISKLAFLDDEMDEVIRELSFDIFKTILTGEYGFKVIEIELGMMYDLLYTKAPLPRTCRGLVLRLITFVLTCSVMVLFPVLVDKHKYSKVDLLITYLLIIVAVVHDIYAALLMVFSDSFVVWLKIYKNHPILETLNPIPQLIFKGSCSSKKRWSNNMSQYTLVSFTANKAKTEMQTSKFLDTTRVMGNYWHCEVSDDLRKLIFMYVKEKAEYAETNRRNRQWRPPFTEFPSIMGIEEPQLNEAKSINEKFEWSIMVWHIATEVWYYSDRDDFVSDQCHKDCKMIKRISRYMMYLLVERPSMLSTGNNDRTKIRAIRNEVERSIGQSRFRVTNDRFGNKFKAQACKSLLERSYTNVEELIWIDPALKRVNEVNGKYAQKLEDKWKVIKNQWMEVLGYAARKCKGNEHAQQLRRGGELLTHVWLLLCHFGLTDHYMVERDDDVEEQIRRPAEDGHLRNKSEGMRKNKSF